MKTNQKSIKHHKEHNETPMQKRCNNRTKINENLGEINDDW